MIVFVGLLELAAGIARMQAALLVVVVIPFLMAVNEVVVVAHTFTCAYLRVFYAVST